MQMLKELKWNSIITSILMIVLGVILFLMPGVSMSVIVTIVGMIAIASGIFNIIHHFVIDISESYYRNDLLFGLVSLIFGILILVRPGFFISLVPFILGIVILVSGLVKLQEGIDAKRIGYDRSMLYIVLAIIDIILGIIILFEPFGVANILFMIIGLGLVYSGVSDLYVTLYLSKRFKEYYKDNS